MFRKPKRVKIFLEKIPMNNKMLWEFPEILEDFFLKVMICELFFGDVIPGMP